MGPTIWVNNVEIQSGEYPKPAPGGSVQINFSPKFDAPPIVVVTPRHEHATAPVQSVETIVEITKDHFSVLSQNGGPDYWIEWIAVGKRDY